MKKRPTPEGKPSALDQRQHFTPEGLPPVNLGWRSELAARVPAFRLHACYDVHSDARRVRRALERLARKTKLKGGK